MIALFRHPLNLILKLLGKKAEHPHLSADVFPSLAQQPSPSPFILATTTQEKSAYSPEVTGTIPADLQGVLYRNGPGIFDRADLRKRFVLEGDGLIQKYEFTHQAVTYQSRFVRTKKYVAENKAGKFKYATWGTMAPGGVANNLMPGLGWKTSSGVSVWKKSGRLFAFDEMALPYELDPDTLATVGPYNFVADNKGFMSTATI